MNDYDSLNVRGYKRGCLAAATDERAAVIKVDEGGLSGTALVVENELRIL